MSSFTLGHIVGACASWQESQGLYETQLPPCGLPQGWLRGHMAVLGGAKGSVAWHHLPLLSAEPGLAGTPHGLPQLVHI